METVKPKQPIVNITKEEFERNERQRQDNVTALVAHIQKAESKIYFDKKLLEMKKSWDLDQFKTIDPSTEYENSKEWLEYSREVQIHVLNETIIEEEAILVKDKEGLRLEEIKLKLIKEGIPAWNMSDKQVEEKQQ